MAVDKRGDEIKVGDTVVRAFTSGRLAYLEIVKVTSLKNGNPCLDGRHVPVTRTASLLILERGNA